nr:proteasome assembly chaperone 2 [Arenicola marina]
MFVSCNKSKILNWKDYTLLIPAVSVANVGQLATDLVISTLYMSKVGSLYDSSIIPLIGNDPFAAQGASNVCNLSTAAEVYEDTSRHLVAVQLRSALVQGCRQQFLTRLMEWIESCGFRQVIILTSSYAHERRDEQLFGPQFRYVSSPKLDSTEDGLRLSDTALKFTKLERRPDHVYDYATRQSSHGDEEEVTSVGEEPAQDAEEEAVRQWSKGLFVPGGGYAKELLQKCMHRGVAAAVLLMFVSEGDNALDAIRLATHLNQWQKWIDLTTAAQQSPSSGHVHGWKQPSSWKLMFGSGFSQSLF